MSDIHTIRLNKNGNLCDKPSAVITIALGVPELEEIRQEYYDQYSLYKDQFHLNASKAIWDYLQAEVYA